VEACGVEEGVERKSAEAVRGASCGEKVWYIEVRKDRKEELIREDAQRGVIVCINCHFGRYKVMILLHKRV